MAVKRARGIGRWGLVESGEPHVGHLVEYLPDAPRCPWCALPPRGPSGGRLTRPRDPRMPKAAPTKTIQARGGGPPSGCQSPNGRPVLRGTPLAAMESGRVAARLPAHHFMDGPSPRRFGGRRVRAPII